MNANECMPIRLQEELRKHDEDEPVTVDSLFDSSSFRPAAAAMAASAAQEASAREREEASAAAMVKAKVGVRA